jgi:hypothetical protein
MSELNGMSVEPELTGPDAPEQAPENTGGAGEETLLAGKFKSTEELERAYQELQKKMGEQGGGGGSEKADGEVTTKDAEGASHDEATEVLKVAGLDMADFTTEYEKDGKLSDASYKRLEEAGFPRAVVDTYIDGMTAKQKAAEADAVLTEKAITEIKGFAGGEDAYTQMVQWAGQNLTEKEIAAYDAVMNSGDVEQIKLAVAGLKMRYVGAMGMEPNLVGGRASGSNAGDVFRSSHEVMTAMRDPRYGRDAAYTREIEDKLVRSDVFQPVRG